MNSQVAKTFRKRNINTPKQNKLSQEVYELAELSTLKEERLETQIEISPKK